MISPAVLCGYEFMSLKQREKRRVLVFENMVLKSICGSEREEMSGEWRKLRNEELNNLYPSRSVICVIKSRRMRWAAQVACMRKVNLHTEFWCGNLKLRIACKTQA